MKKLHRIRTRIYISQVFILLFTVAVPLAMQGQNTVTINTVQIVAPYTATLSTYANNPSKVVISVQVNVGVPDQKVKLLATLMGDNGVQIKSTAAAINVLPEITLSSTNTIQVVNGTYIQNLFNLEFVDIQGTTATALVTDGLPPGNYQLCVQAVTSQIDPATGQQAGIPVSDEKCSAPFTISPVNPTSVAVSILNVQVVAPYNSHLLDFLNNPAKVIITVYSNTTVDSYKIKLLASLKGDNGILITTNPTSLKTIDELMLKKGIQTLVLNASAIQNIFEVEDVLLNGITYNDLVNSAGLPEGTYQLCVIPVAAEINAQLQQQAGDHLADERCSNPFTITNLEPPVLINPFSGSDVQPKQPQNVIFNWSIPAGAKPGIQYEFRMVEIWDSTRNVNDAFQTATNPPFFERITQANTLLFGPGEPSLTAGNRYAFTVTATDPNNNLVFRNGGRSEVGYFAYKGKANQNIPVVNNNNNGPPPEINLSQLTGDLNCSCKTPAPTGPVDNSDLKQYSKVQVGNFVMTIVSVTVTNGKAKGEGKIPIPFLNISQANIRVLFDEMTVKREKGLNVMMAGIVKAKRDNSIGLSPNVDDPKAGVNPFTVDDVKNLEKYYTTNSNQLISNIKNASVDFNMPLGIDKEVGGKRIIISLVDFVFTPAQAGFSAAMAYTIPDDNTIISLGAKNICFKDASNFCGDLFLFLTNDLKINALNLTLKAISKSDSGTYVAFDKDGFTKLRVRADYEFSQNLIVQKSDKKSPVTATLIADVVKWSDWMATINIDPFVIADNQDFAFDLKGVATYDHSDVRNPEGMPTKAIENKTNFLDNTWYGFLMPELDITLPEIFKNSKTNKPIDMKVLNMMIDKMGLTGDITADDVLGIDDGNLDGWGYSLDHVDLRFVNNTYVKGSLNGKILLPITNKNVQSELDYNSTLTHQDNDVKKPLAFNFVIKPKNTIEVPIFIAKVDILNTSSIVVSVDSKEFKAVATLNGSMNITTPQEGIMPAIELVDMKFEKLVLQSKPKYFSVEKFTMKLGSPQKSASSFPFSISKVDLTTDNGIGLTFNVDFTLADIKAMPKASSTLSIKGNAPEFKDGKLKFDFDPKLSLDKISIEGDMSVLKVKGFIQFYKGDVTYGDGFKGAISATFPTVGVGIEAALQIGSVNNYQYWYVDAMVDFGKTGVPLFPSTALYGFGGGAYYNMTSSYDLTKTMAVASTSAEVKPGESPSKVNYIPSSGKMGIKATILFGLQQRETFNADVSMELRFNTNGGIEYFGLSGEGRVVSKEKTTAMGRGTVKVEYQFDKQIFDLNASLNIDLKVAKAYGTLALHAEQSGFYLKVGKAWPVSDRVNITLGVKPLALNGNFYLQAGTMGLDDLPPVPIEIQQILDKSGVNTQELLTKARNGLQTKGGGLILGGGVNFNAEGCFLIICGKVYAGVGFDVSFREYNTDCNGNPASSSSLIGVDGWYAVGQAYAGVQASLYIDLGLTKATIFDAGAGAVLVAKLPNPEYFAGAVGGYYELFGMKNNFNFEFETGKVCKPDGNPLSQLKLIADIDPHEGDQEVEININPQIITNLEIGKEFILKEDVGTELRERTFRFTMDNIVVKLKAGDKDVTFKKNLGEDGKTVIVFSTEYLKGETDYVLEVVATLDEYTTSWNHALEKDGKTIFMETYTIPFKTNKGIKSLSLSDVKYTIPYQGERNFCYANVAQGLINSWKTSSFDIFDIENKGDPSYEISFLARFVPAGASPPSSKITTVPVAVSGNNFLFDIPTDLLKETVYAVQFIGQWKFKGKQTMIMKSISSPEKSMYAQRNTSTDNQYFENKRINDRRLSIEPFQQMLFQFAFRTSKYTDYVEKMKTLQVMAGDFKAQGDRDKFGRTVSAGEKELADAQKLNALLAGTYLRHGNLTDARPISFCVYGSEPYDVYDVDGKTIQSAGNTYQVQPLLDFKTECFDQWAKSLYENLAATIKAGGLNSLSLNSNGVVYFPNYEAASLPPLTDYEMRTGFNTGLATAPTMKCGSEATDLYQAQATFAGFSGLSGNTVNGISSSIKKSISYGGFQSAAPPFNSYVVSMPPDPKAASWKTIKDLTLNVTFSYGSMMNGGGNNNYNVVSANQVISSVYGASLHAGGSKKAAFSTFYQNMGNAYDKITSTPPLYLKDPCFKTNFNGIKRPGAQGGNQSVMYPGSK